MYIPQKVRQGWFVKGLFYYGSFQIHRTLEPVTKRGITSNFFLNWWTDPEADITPDLEEATTTSTTETKVLEVLALAPDHSDTMILPTTVQYKCRPEIKGDGTNTVYLTKARFEFGVIGENKLIKLHEYTAPINVSTTSSSYVAYYVNTHVMPMLLDKIVPILTNLIYYKIELYGYVSGGTGYFALDVRFNQPHNMIRLGGWRMKVVTLADYKTKTITKRTE